MKTWDTLYMLKPVEDTRGAVIAYDLLRLFDGELAGVDRYSIKKFFRDENSGALYYGPGLSNNSPIRVITDRQDEAKELLQKADEFSWFCKAELYGQSLLVKKILLEFVKDLGKFGIKPYYVKIIPKPNDTNYLYNVDVVIGYPFAWEKELQGYVYGRSANVILSFHSLRRGTSQAPFLEAFASIKTFSSWSALESNKVFSSEDDNSYIRYCKNLVREIVDTYYKLK